VKRLRASKKFLPIGLLNARSVASKPDVIHHHLFTFDLDILAISETWLTPEHGDEILANTIPEGYVGIHVPRVGRQGGGIAVIHRSTICVSRLPIVFESPFFEQLALSLTVNTVFVKIAIIYRPPSVSCPKFLSDFSDYLEILSVGAGKLLILVILISMSMTMHVLLVMGSLLLLIPSACANMSLHRLTSLVASC
jgi:hypothetical protein